jgi:hypothetical protein
MKFTPKEIEINYTGYNNAVKNAHTKLDNFNKALEFAYSSYVDEKDLSDVAFNESMLNEFKRCFLLKNSKLVRLDIGYNKLLDLLDVNIDKLKEFEYQHHENPAELIQVDKKTVSTKVDLKTFTIYTKNESENQRLEAAYNLIDALEKVSGFSKVYPLTITQGISNFLLFDTAKNVYKLNRTLMPKIVL